MNIKNTLCALVGAVALSLPVTAAESEKKVEEEKTVVLDVVDGTGNVVFSQNGYTIKHTHKWIEATRECLYSYAADKKEVTASVTNNGSIGNGFLSGSTLEFLDKGADGSVDNVFWETFSGCKPPETRTYKIKTTNGVVVLAPVTDDKMKDATLLPKLPYLLQAQQTFDGWKRETKAKVYDVMWKNLDKNYVISQVGSDLVYFARVTKKNAADPVYVQEYVLESLPPIVDVKIQTEKPTEPIGVGLWHQVNTNSLVEVVHGSFDNISPVLSAHIILNGKEVYKFPSLATER